MALETSPQAPAPVRQIAQRVGRLDRPAGSRVGRGPGRPGQPPGRRRQGLHDPARLGGRHLDPGDLPARGLRRAGPASGRGREHRRPGQAVVLRQPGHALPGGPRDQAGRPRGAARPPRAAPAAAGGRGAVRPGAQTAAARSCRAASAWSPHPTRPPSATWSRTPAAGGPRWSSRSAYAAMQGSRAAGEVIAAIDRLDRDERVDVIVVARGGGVGRGPAAVLRRGAGPGGLRSATPRWSRRSATSPTSRSSTWSPTSAPRRRPTPPSWSFPTSPRSSASSPWAGTGCVPRWSAGSTARRTLIATLRSRPALADPGSLLDGAGRRGRGAA